MYITASDRYYPQKTAILLNPQSGRLRKHLQTMRQLAASVPRARVHETNSLSELERNIDELAQLGIDHLIVAGGDGTVQAVINRLFNSNRWPSLPSLSIIPGGTTNMTATDIGSIGNPRSCLDRLSRRLREMDRVQLLTRPVLQVHQGDRPIIHGMFFGAGIIARGSELFDKKIKKTGMTGESASAIVILHLLAGLLSGHRSGVWAPVRIGLQDDGGLRQDNNTIMVFASTLGRLLLGLRPYWGAGEGSIRTTCVRESPRNFWRSLLKIICRRGGGLSLKDGYYSRNNHWLELIMDTGFIVDGEFFDCDSGNGPLRITTAGPIRFLQP